MQSQQMLFTASPLTTQFANPAVATLNHRQIKNTAAPKSSFAPR